jgi:hypothetical protein
LVESAAMGLAMARFLAAKAGATGDPVLMKQSSSMSCDARQHELAAWELAAREAQMRAKATRVDPQAAMRHRMGMGNGSPPQGDEK